MLENLLQIMKKQLEELASLNTAKMELYQQLMESKALTNEAISAILKQDEASELEYRACVAELRDRLRASSPAGIEWGGGCPSVLYQFGSGAPYFGLCSTHSI